MRRGNRTKYSNRSIKKAYAERVGNHPDNKEWKDTCTVIGIDLLRSMRPEEFKRLLYLVDALVSQFGEEAEATSQSEEMFSQSDMLSAPSRLPVTWDNLATNMTPSPAHSTHLPPTPYTDMFILDRVQFTPPSAILCMAVSNNVAMLVLESHRMLRIDIQQANSMEEIELPKKSPDDAIHKLFLDPTGRHALLSTVKGEVYYYFNKWRKAKALSKLKGSVIESIGWNKTATRSSDISTRAILVGTNDGRIIETEIEPSDGIFAKDEKYAKQQFAFPDKVAITGLRCDVLANTKQAFILATTRSRIYQFVGALTGGSQFGADGGPVFDKVFKPYEEHQQYQEIPGELSNSAISFFETEGSSSERFTWLTGAGMYSGSIAFGAQNPGETFIENAILLPYPDQVDAIPISVALSEFHVMLLYADRVVATCQLNDQLAYEELSPGGEVFKQLCVDPLKKTYWIYSSHSLYELIVSDESRDVWRLYLEKRSYDLALQYARSQDQRNFIRSSQADQLFEQGKMLKAASYYAQSARPFEEIALKFFAKDDADALRVYLRKWLDETSPGAKGPKMQLTMVATWLLELYLAKLNTLEDTVLIDKSPGSADREHLETEKKLVHIEYKDFVDHYKDMLDQKVAYQLLESHLRTEQLLYYAQSIKDMDCIVQHWVEEGDFSKALEILVHQGSVESYYKFATVLMKNVPVDTVSAWIRQPEMQVRRLLPALLHYNHGKNAKYQNQAIRYLEYVVFKLKERDVAIHNLLLMLYASQPGPESPDLLSFVKGTDEANFNVDYALRVCSEYGRGQSCVYLFGRMDMYEEAVDLALREKDTELARIFADKAIDDDTLRKRLWLKIAKHVVEEKKDIKAAMAYLKYCNLLKIEDVLPFFPDFALIDDFKEEICHALEEYNSNIEQLKEAMDDATRSAEAIRQDMDNLQNRFSIVTADDRCAICERAALTRQFYVFPCQHIFHTDCLQTQVSPHLGKRQQQRLIQIQDRLASQAYARNQRPRNNSMVVEQPLFPFRMARRVSTIPASVETVEKLREEFDNLVASECYLCGDMSIRTIDRPFVSMMEERDEVNAWHV